MAGFGSAGYVKLVMFLLRLRRCLSDFWLRQQNPFRRYFWKLFLLSVMITEGRLEENPPSDLRTQAPTVIHG